MSKSFIAISAAFSLFVSTTAGAVSLPAPPAPPPAKSLIVPAEGGCGPYGWRGPWGGCRGTPYYGPPPYGYYRYPPYVVAYCPPGYWRGPWGHCRNTPYHGRLPGGGYQP